MAGAVLLVITAIIQARMGSTRLPGKALRSLGGRPVLSWVVRAARLSCVDAVVVATTTEADDDPVAELARAEGCLVSRGSPTDVLGRFVQAVHEHGGEAVVRLTADCPLLDPLLIDAAVNLYRAAGVHYVSTVVRRSLPRGLDVEVVSSRLLFWLDGEAEGSDRVHVTSLLYRRDSRRPPWDSGTGDLSIVPSAADLRVTLDTEEDAMLLEALVEGLGDDAHRAGDVIAYLRSHPEVAALNEAVQQKSLDQG